LTLSGANSYTGATTISDGTLIVENNAPSLATSSFGGAGALIIQSAGAGFTSTLSLSGSKILNTLGSLTVGKTSNTQFINLSGTITTIGQQTYNSNPSHAANGTDAVNRGIQVSGATTLNTTNSNITLNGTVYRASGAPNLTVNAGSGDVEFTGNIGTWTGGDGGALGVVRITARTLTARNIRAEGLTITNSGDSTITGRVSWVTTGITKSGNGKLTFTGADPIANNLFTGGVTVNAGTLATSTSEAFGASGTVNLAGGNLLISETVTLGSGHLFTLNSAATVTVNDGKIFTIGGVVSGTAGLTKEGTGTLNLNGANTYTGLTNISAGTLKLGNATALGTVAAGTSITSGAVLDLNGQTIANAEALTVNGTGILSGGAVINSSSTAASYAGLVTLGSASSIIGGSGTIALTNAGTITGATFDLILGGAQGGSIASIIGITTGTVTKQDAGTWTLSGANTYSGGTTITAGTLSISSDANLGTAPGSVTANSINLNGGTLLVTADMTLNSNRGITLGASSTINVETGDTLTYGGIITDGASSFALTKAGAGTLLMSGANTYDGGTSVTGGLLKAGIDGIKYPAESIARGATSDNARGFNYVVFDENAVSIQEVIKFQKDANKARGAMIVGLDGRATI
jgi:autotransporter-associated beta strand protein